MFYQQGKGFRSKEDLEKIKMNLGGGRYHIETSQIAPQINGLVSI